MALIAPIAFAAAGGLLSGGATWGMAAGWLIGSWLFNQKDDEKNKVFDPGAEEMPSFNQALRGATMPIMFGTNRVSSNIVWANNFKEIRKETKSGGGGGKFKVGQPSSTEVTYEYKWDLMFHIGMTDQNVDVIGAWVGTEKINGSTIAAILANSDSQWATFTGLTGGDGVDLNFEDSYYHGAGATGADIDQWAHFQSVTGGPYRFPYTVYVGFKQLELGNTARVPQISWEIGEGGATLTADGATVESEIPANGTYMAQGAHPYGYIVRAQDGTLLKVADNANFAGPTNTTFAFIILENLETGISTGQILTEAQFVTDFNTFWGGSFAGTGSITLGYSCTVIEDRYLLASRRYDTFAFEYMLYTVDDGDGNITPVGSMRFGDPGIDSYWQNLNFSSISGAGTDDDYIHYYTNGGAGVGNYNTYHWKGPSINQMKAGTWYLTGANDIVNGLHSVAIADGANGETDTVTNHTYYDIPGAAGSTSEIPSQRKGFSLPKVTIGLISLEYSDVFYYYTNKSTCQWHLDNPGTGSNYIETTAGTYPNGFMSRVEKTWVVTDGVSIVSDDVGTASRVNNKFVDLVGNQVLPFDDEYQDEDGNVNSQNSYHEYTITTQPLRTGFGAGGFLVIFWKNIYDTSDFNKTSPVGYPTRARVFIYNPITEVFTQYANLFGSVMSDLETDMSAGDWSSGVPALGVNDGITSAGTLGGYYDEVTGNLYAVWGIRLGLTNGNSINEQVGLFGNLNISGGEDITPPVIIYRILTSSVYGLGLSEDDIDLTSYGLANQYCEAEGIKVSAQYRREEGALAIITQLLELYGGFLIDSGGKIKFGLQEFSSSTVRTIDNDHLRVDQEGEPPVLITKGARQDTYNRVKVNYFDRSLAYRQNFIEVADEVDMDINGIRAQEFPAKFVMGEATARKMAVRALWGNMYARDIYDFKLGAKDADLEPGDVVTLVDSFHSELQSGKQARIVTWQETEPLTFQVKAVEEVEYISVATLAADDVTEATSNSIMSRAQPLATFGMYELPAEYQGAEAQLYVGYRQQSKIMGARLYTSPDGITYALQDQISPYIVSGIMANPLPLRPPGYVEEGVEIYLMPDQLSSGSFNPSSPLYAQELTLDDVTAAGRAAGIGNIWINSEMMAFEGVNLLGQNYYSLDKLYRGWGGTHIQDHSSGDTWWRQGGGVFSDTINVDQIGTIIYYKVTGYNFAGQEYDVSSVNARTYQIQGTFWRPQVQAPLATYVQSPGSYLTVQSEDLGYIQKKQVVAGGSPVQIEWPQAAQEAGYGAQGYGIGLYGRFSQDTTSVSYRVEVLSSDLTTVVRCTTVDTTAYNYSTAVNSEDWNGWTGNFAVRVTPYNPYGTALRSRTKILELFE